MPCSMPKVAGVLYVVVLPTRAPVGLTTVGIVSTTITRAALAPDHVGGVCEASSALSATPPLACYGTTWR